MERWNLTRLTLMLSCLAGCVPATPNLPKSQAQGLAAKGPAQAQPESAKADPQTTEPPKAEPAEVVAEPPEKQPAEESAAEALAAKTPTVAPTLDLARQRIQAREWDAADEELTRFLREVSRPELRRSAEILATEIAQGRALDAMLAKATVDLGSPDPITLARAQGLLWQNDVLAGPLLIEACRHAEPRVVTAALSLLTERRQNEPAATAALGVLERPEQAAAWPAAIATLVRLNPPSTGERLLDLSLAATSPEQQVAALEGLAQCQSPPARTFPALLPVLVADGPALAPALLAASRAALLHHQRDFITRRGLESLSPDELAAIEKLAPRLRQLAPPDSRPTSPVACGAWILATVLGFEQPVSIDGVRALAASGDRDPAGLVDGVWKLADAKPTTQWVDPATGRDAWVVLDLGSPQIVTGVRIWNYSLYSSPDRGWRKVEIEILDDLAGEPRSSTVGNLPRFVPALKDADYSSVIDIPATRGRYLRLFAREIWSDQWEQKVSGLAEIEVLGVKAPQEKEPARSE